VGLAHFKVTVTEEGLGNDAEKLWGGPGKSVLFPWVQTIPEVPQLVFCMSLVVHRYLCSKIVYYYNTVYKLEKHTSFTFFRKLLIRW
jgi:hypothetical protein